MFVRGGKPSADPHAACGLHRLDSTRLNNHDDKLYCNTCYSKEFGPKGYGFAGGHAGLMQEENAQPTPVRAGAPEPFKAAPAEPKAAPVVSTPAPPAEVKAAPSKPAASRFGGSAPKCPTCNKSVYAAEEVKANNASYHRGLCFVCKQCGKSLEKGKEKVHDGDIFCEPCHSAHFGPKGFRASAGKMLTE